MLDALANPNDAMHQVDGRTRELASEHYIAITADGDLDFDAQIRNVEARYREAQAALNLAPETAIFRRIFLSDAANQAELVRGSTLFRGPEHSPAAVAVVQQPPLPGSKIALLAYHIAGEGTSKRQISPHQLLIERHGVRHLWSVGLCASETTAPTPVEDQTTAAFGRLTETLSDAGATLAENCVRTWLYVKDVDVSYRGMVEARCRFFREQGLTEATHYIASTGIEGACAHQFDLVMMDAYSLLDIDPRQMSYLEALDLLCPTKNYNVHFERGTKLAFGDRAHYFISGTASIDRAGRVVHPGNVVRQLDRTLTNVDGLLRSGGANLGHMTHLLVYLRDAADYPRIRAAVAERMAGIPIIYLKAPVCRPEWLVEVEGVAIAKAPTAGLPIF